jgi:hypothetical protein
MAGGWLGATMLAADEPTTRPRTPAASAVTTAGPDAAGGPAPTDVRLRDGWDSVTLTWRYPGGAEGPVLVAGGRVGERQQAFQTLAAGTTTFTVYGLAARADYCFTVAVVYSTDAVSRSAPVCTRRGASPSPPR